MNNINDFESNWSTNTNCFLRILIFEYKRFKQILFWMSGTMNCTELDLRLQWLFSIFGGSCGQFCINLANSVWSPERPSESIFTSRVVTPNRLALHIEASASAWDGTGCEFDSWQCRIYIPCSLSLRLLGSPSGFSGYIWLDTKIVLKKKKHRCGFCQPAAGARSIVGGHVVFVITWVRWIICEMTIITIIMYCSIQKTHSKSTFESFLIESPNCG